MFFYFIFIHVNPSRLVFPNLKCMHALKLAHEISMWSLVCVVCWSVYKLEHRNQSIDFHLKADKLGYYKPHLGWLRNRLMFELVTSRGVIWGGPSPPPPKEKGKKKEKKRKEKKIEKKKKERKKGTMNNVKLLHIKCCFYNFSIIRWNWKL